MEITKEVLISLYLDKNMSLQKISNELGVGIRVIRTRMDRFGIERRPFVMKGRQTRLGAILSDETKKKISLAHKGKKLTPEHREKVLKTLIFGLKGSHNPNWNGGVINRHGYVYFLNPSHPSCHKNGYIKRAVIVAEEKIGRHLFPNEVTHHINGIKDDDRPENIEVLTASQHNTITMKERWLNGEFNNRILKKNQANL